MSWLFGSGNKKNIPPDFATLAGISPPVSPEGGTDDHFKDKNRTQGYGFDSTGLERAAAAAKELEKSSKDR